MAQHQPDQSPDRKAPCKGDNLSSCWVRAAKSSVLSLRRGRAAQWSHLQYTNMALMNSKKVQQTGEGNQQCWRRSRGVGGEVRHGILTISVRSMGASPTCSTGCRETHPHTGLKPSVPCFATVAATNRNTQRMHTYLGGEEQLGTDNKQTAASPCCRTRLHWLWTRARSLCCSDLTQTMRSDFSSTVCCKSSTRTEFIVCVNASVSERGVFSRNPKGD